MMFDQKQPDEKCVWSTVSGPHAETHLPAADDDVDDTLKTTASAF